MIIFSSGNILSNNDVSVHNHQGDFNYILSIKSDKGCCTSKVLSRATFKPSVLTILLVFDTQTDIAAIPELCASVYVPWHSADVHRIKETAFAFLNAGLDEDSSCCVAIAIDIIYKVINRDAVDYMGLDAGCVFNALGMPELKDDARQRVFENVHVAPDYLFDPDPYEDDSYELPF